MRSILVAFAVISGADGVQGILLPNEPAACQFGMLKGFVTPNEIRAVDNETHEVLFDLPAGKSVAEDVCVNAPNGHQLFVTGVE